VASVRDPKNIGGNVRRLRVAAGLTQGQLSERADVADATISRVERGRLEPSSTLLGKLAHALKVRADDLLGPVREPGKPRYRASVAKLVATVEDLDDAAIDDVTKAVKLILGVARRGGRRG
jgi:transcriptional regulator with XRE-family HTH domain